MARDDAGVAINQDRIRETELADAGGDLRDLGVGVRARILRIGDQPVERPMLDVPGQNWR